MVNALKLQTLYTILLWNNSCFLCSLFLKILSEMANSVDSDQTAPWGAVWSESTLFAYAILSETLVYEIFRYLAYLYFNYILLVWNTENSWDWYDKSVMKECGNLDEFQRNKFFTKVSMLLSDRFFILSKHYSLCYLLYTFLLVLSSWKHHKRVSILAEEQ